MSKHRQLVYGAQIPQDWLDAIQELISTYISPNAVATVLNATTVQVAAGTVNDEVGVSIGGAWRYNTAAASATHPGGAAGTYNLWATSAANSFTIGPPEVDSTVYSFGLQILAVGSTPGTALSRIIGSVQWNGTAITDANLLFDDPATHGSLMPGDVIISASPTRAGALLCDGTSYLRTTYPALFNALGGTASVFGLPDGTHFQVPDYRGRTLVGVGTGAGLTARALGATGGEENHLLSAVESGVAAHTHPAGGTVSIPGLSIPALTIPALTVAGLSIPGLSVPALSIPSLTVNVPAHDTLTESTSHSHNPIGTSGAGGVNNTFGVAGSVAPDFSSNAGSGPASNPHTHHVNAFSGSTNASSTGTGTTGTGTTGAGATTTGVTGTGTTGTGTSGTLPATQAASAAAAASAHNNMQPWATGYYYVKI